MKKILNEEEQIHNFILCPGAYPGGMHRMHVHPPQPERMVMRKDEAVGNKKKMQVCLPAT